MILKRLYYAFIYPNLTFCNLVWGNAASTHLNKLFLLQKKAVRIITNSAFLDHTDPHFTRTGILRMGAIHKYLACQYFFKNKNKFSTLDNSHDNRNRTTFIVPSYQRLSSSQRSISHIVPQIYNSLPSYLKKLILLNCLAKT